MKKLLFSGFLYLSAAGFLSAQGSREAVEATFDDRASISYFRYLASDELMGRDPIRPEVDAAARFIAEQFWKYGAISPENLDAPYYQHVPFRLSIPPAKGQIMAGERTFSQGKELMVLDGGALEGNYPLVVVGYGLADDYAGKEVAGKVVVCNVGAPGRLSPSDLFAMGREKMRLAAENGAAGIIEVYNVPTAPWEFVTRFLNSPRLSVDQGAGEAALPYAWVQDPRNTFINAVGSGSISEATFEITGKENRPIIGKNVIAVIEGTDPALRDEYIMLSAHYDHVGVGTPNAEGDSIYNGARDNAVGTVALINAARYFAQHPPKRSVILAAWTAEEKGLLGSGYYVEHPVVPLRQTIYNLNIDNAGYNDTSIISVIGLGRTSADPLISEAVAAFGLRAIADPAPEQNLYDRSDNVNFARKGVPSPTFSLGFTAFDEEIARHYHQPSDEVDNFDLDYALLYWKSYLLAADKIANAPDRPKWTAGDKYEEAARALYGNQLK